MWQNYGISAKLDVDISAGLERYLRVKYLFCGSSASRLF